VRPEAPSWFGWLMVGYGWGYWARGLEASQSCWMEVGGCGAWCFVVVVGGRVSGGMVC
jgi:hypothetical protein